MNELESSGASDSAADDRKVGNGKQLALRRYSFLVLVVVNLATTWRYSGLYYQDTYEVSRMTLYVPALVSGAAGSLFLYAGAGFLAVTPKRSKGLFAISFIFLSLSTYLWSGIHGRWFVPLSGTVLALYGWLLARLALGETHDEKG